MKKVAMTVVTAFVFLMAMAFAQDNSQTPDTNSGSQGTQQSSPSMSGSQDNTQSPSSMGQSSNSGQMKGDHMKGEKTLKGCIENEGGTYKLDEKSGKEVMLSGADVSAHAGHEVKLHGSWENGSSAMGAGSDNSGSMGSSAKSGKTFNVTSVDMVSESCKSGKKSKSSMDNSTAPPQK
jgi:hypothetical protein